MIKAQSRVNEKLQDRVIKRSVLDFIAGVVCMISIASIICFIIGFFWTNVIIITLVERPESYQALELVKSIVMLGFAIGLFMGTHIFINTTTIEKDWWQRLEVD
jgi:hypothetical protein